MGINAKTVSCTIDISESTSLSLPVFIGGCFSFVGIKYPAAWTAADVSFQVSFDGVTYENLRDDLGNEITKTVTASQFCELDSSEFKTAVYVKIRSGTAATPVEQEADRSFTLYKRRYLAA